MQLLILFSGVLHEVLCFFSISQSILPGFPFFQIEPDHILYPISFPVVFVLWFDKFFKVIIIILMSFDAVFNFGNYWLILLKISLNVTPGTKFYPLICGLFCHCRFVNVPPLYIYYPVHGRSPISVFCLENVYLAMITIWGAVGDGKVILSYSLPY